VVAVAALVELDGDRDRISRAALALAGVAPTPARATSAERALAGAPAADAGAIRDAADAAGADLSPAGDMHASAETRRGLARTYLRRGIELAVSRARNER
jgi:carbon-monoxide dehydrogenase medium subunit